MFYLNAKYKICNIKNHRLITFIEQNCVMNKIFEITFILYYMNSSASSR